ncbi:MAG: arsenate reductase family protein [Ruminococcus sp.]|nr:arsenate reductase family protein [Ruminococcus sp.]
MTFICYPKCSTCKKAQKWLEEKGKKFEVRNIKENNPTAKEISEWHKASGLPLKRFFNTSGNLYKEMGLKDKLADMSEEEQIRLLSTDGMLVKRPILVEGDTVLVGFKAEEWEKKI